MNPSIVVRESERGSAALGALAVLILVAAFAAAAYLPLASGVRAATRAIGKAEARVEALEAVLAALTVLEEGAADGVDSRAELEALETSFDGVLLVDDVSSLFNPTSLPMHGAESGVPELSPSSERHRTAFLRIFAKPGGSWYRAIVRMENREDGTPEMIVVEFREGGPEDDPLQRHD